MEKEHILYLVTKKISGEATDEDIMALQAVLQKRLGISDTHKIFLHLYNIESLIHSAKHIRRQETDICEKQQNASKQKSIRVRSNNYLSPHFFVHNSLFRIYCTLTLRQLGKILG